MRALLFALIVTGLSSQAYGQDKPALTDDQLQARIDAALEERQQEALRGGQGSFALPLVEIPLYEGQVAEFGQHVVADGDTLYGLSKRYAVSIADIQRANAMSDYSVTLGQTLRIPGVSSLQTIPALHQSTATDAQALQTTTHVVVAGDTFFAIAKQHCLKSTDLMQANPDIDVRALRIGASLQVPATACPPKSATQP
ncbi:MAG: LysM peptidoglycan-binding domain-containing protein [Pseudomonadota bacterium]